MPTHLNVYPTPNTTPAACGRHLILARYDLARHLFLPIRTMRASTTVTAHASLASAEVNSFAGSSVRIAPPFSPTNAHETYLRRSIPASSYLPAVVFSERAVFVLQAC